MSRRTVNNHLDLQGIIGTSFTNTKNTAHRQLIVIGLAPKDWLKQFAQTRDIPFISANTHTDQSDRITAFLGAEHPVLAHQISDPLDASLLAALAGTVTHSGVLILAIDLDYNEGDTSLFNDNNNVQLHSNSQQRTQSNFSHRFSKLLEAAEKKYPNNIVLANYQTNNEISDEAYPNLQGFQTPLTQRNPIAEFTQAQDEQNSLLLTACELLATNKSLCISIVGKRGRGKSALTARIANWLSDQNMSYRITAVHSSALSTFHSMTDHPSDENFIPAQELGKCNIDTLLVDEASNMPLGLLQKLMPRHNRLILCTTVEGYESSGRAFELRIQHSIKQNFESQLQLSPKQPWRWLADDPIESLVDSLVLNGARSACQPKDFLDSNGSCNIQEDSFNIRKITQQELLEDEQQLENVFGLLRDTHYQTTVKDLQHLLDGKDVLLWVLEEKNSRNIVGVLLLTLEFGIDRSLHEAILRKKRRLPHHLLTQLLAQTANSTDHLTSCFARVVRISVVQSMRRNAIGSILLNYVEQELMINSEESEGIDAIGASFANDSASVNFWRYNGYTTFHTGYRKNPRTGEHAVAVLKTQDATINKTLNTAARIIVDNQAWQLAKSNPGGSEFVQPLSYLEQRDQQLLEQFAKGYRSVHDTYAALSRLSLNYPVSLEASDGFSRKRFEASLREQVKSILEL